MDVPLHTMATEMGQRLLRAVHAADIRLLPFARMMYSLPRRVSFRSTPSDVRVSPSNSRGFTSVSLNQLGRLSEILLVGSLEVLDPSVMKAQIRVATSSTTS
jgi:hypothetical protein